MNVPRRIGWLALALCLPAVGIGLPAGAAGPGSWERINDLTIASTTEVGLARTGDGLLHVIWVEDDGTSWNLMHVSVQPDGTVSTPNPVVAGYGFMDPVPDLVAINGSQLRAFFGGSPPNKAGGLWTSVSDDGGQTWTAPALVNSRTFWGGNVTAVETPDRSLWQQTGTLLHKGLSPSTRDVDLGSQWGDCCVYGARLGVDSATSQLWTAVYATEDTTHDPPIFNGAYAQQLNASTGSPIGDAIHMPGSSVTFEGQEQSSNPGRRMPLTARVGGGLFLAFAGGYPGVQDVLVWKLGDPTSYTVAHLEQGLEDSAIAMAAAPDGRLWILWGTETVPSKVFASISNTDYTAWSPAFSVKSFSGDEYGDIYGIQASASSNRLDVIVNKATVAEAGVYHTQIPVPAAWTAGDDVLVGSSGDDHAYGGPGNDELSGLGGNDQLYGGDGNDKVAGGAGVDVVNGGTGNDVLNGGSGRDRVVGGPGKDTCIFDSKKELSRSSGCENKKRNFKRNF